MVTVDISFDELKKNVSSELTVDKLEEALLNLGLEIDEANGDDLKIEIGADRADLISIQGLIRLLRAYYGSPYKGFEVVKSDRKVVIDPSVKDVWPHTVSVVVKGLNLNDELLKNIINFQEKLHATYGRKRKKVSIGIYPLEKIVFPIDYVAMAPEDIVFTPLGSESSMNGKEILENTSVGKSYGHLLGGSEKYPIFRDASGHILSMPPIINSEYAGKVIVDSTDLFVECSGHDLTALNYTLQIITAMFADMGGSIESLIVVDGEEKQSPQVESRVIKVNAEYVNSILGTKLDSNEISKLLERMLYEVVDDQISVKVPGFRTDVWHKIDLVDDVMKAYGINNLVPTLSEVATTSMIFRETRIKKSVQDYLTSIGFIESFTLTLTGVKDQFENMLLEAKDYVKLGSSEEKSVNMCRVSLLPELLKSLNNNRQHSLPQKLFEVGNVILPANTDVLSKSELRLACVIANTEVSYTDIRQVFDHVVKMLGLNCTVESCEHNSYIKGRVGRILLDGVEIGFIGEIHPQVITNWDLEVPLVGFEMSLQHYVEDSSLALKK